MRYDYHCEICNRDFEEFRFVNDRDNVSCCGVKAQRIVVNEIHTDKDLAYNFDSYSFGKPVHIHSKNQYKKLMKENGMVNLTKEEQRSIKPRDMTSERKKVIKRMTEKMRSADVLKHVPSFLKDKGIIKENK